MSKSNEVTEKKLRQRFASNKPRLIARSEYSVVNGVSMAKAYFNGEVLKYDGKPVSSVREDAGNIKSPSKIKMYLLDKGFDKQLASGANENVSLDVKKVNRMSTPMKQAARQYGG